MAKPRKNAPALYELIGARSRITPPGPHAHSPEEHEEEAHRPAPAPDVEEEVYEEEAHRSILSPGRTVRIPVGYFFFGIAIIIAMAIGGYILGFQMRDAAYEREARRRAQLDATPQEPLENWPVNRSLLDPPSGGSQAAAGQVRPPSPEIGEGPGRLILVGSDTADPREKGVNYAKVATLGKERAMDLAQFLSGRGVDVAVVGTNNARTLAVIALKGFPSGTFRSQERQGFDQSLRMLCDEYAAQGGGRRVYGDPLWEKYD